MKKLIVALALAAMAVPSSAASPWGGKLDLAWNPSAAAYQSFTDARQAVGLEKRIVSLYYGPQEVVKLSAFVGATHDLAAAGAAPVVVGGATIAVPGSLLDWALGTSWGQQWLPKLKTGINASYDLVRPSQAHWHPDFYGFGVAYPVGG